MVLPDTQYYARNYPEIFDAQVQWIASQHDRAGIALVAHEGDIVDADEPVQWQRAAASLHVLDGVVPYVLSAGNHDYRRVGTHIERTTSINAYFSPAAVGGIVSGAGTYEPGRLENSYVVLSPPGGPWLLLSLEFGPRDAVLAWAESILRRYPSAPAIVLTHAYLDADGSRFDHVARHDQLWNPHRYFREDASGGVNDGEEIWQKLISRNDNIRFVICGHALDDGTGRLTSRRRTEPSSTRSSRTSRPARWAGPGTCGSCASPPAIGRWPSGPTRRTWTSSSATPTKSSSSRTDGDDRA